MGISFTFIPVLDAIRGWRLCVADSCGLGTIPSRLLVKDLMLMVSAPYCICNIYFSYRNLLRSGTRWSTQ